MQSIFPGKYVVKGLIGKVGNPHRKCPLVIEANGLLIGSCTIRNTQSSNAVPEPWRWKDCILASYTLRGTAPADVTIRLLNLDQSIKEGLAIEKLSLQRVFYHTRGPYNEL